MTTETKKPGRIAGFAWMKQRPEAVAVYNSSYSPSGARLWRGDKPWTVIGPAAFGMFDTHAEAVAYAFKEAGK